jgi:SH3-like domain-containing protein
MKGKVNANVLNIRAQASTTSDVLGKLSKDQIIEIVKLHGEWYEIKHKDTTAFVAAKFIVELTKTGIVNANLLNIRSLPNLESEKLAQLKKGNELTIVDEMDKWYKIKLKDGFGYVFSEFVDIKKEEPVRIYLFQDRDLVRVPLEPARKLPEAGNRIQVIVKSTYNKYGNMLSLLSRKLGIDLASSIAVLAVESGGVGISKGRVLIRFENHLFYKYWGKDNEAIYRKHFAYDTGKNWLGHKFRKDPNGPWVDFHGNQSLEYEVLDFARSLDNEKALLSISMGLPQILGSNAKIIGYQTVQEMFDNFNADIRYHIFGLFDFFSPRMIKYLKVRDFVSFARYYNGQGQAERYGKFIQDYYDAFPKDVK